MIIYESRPDVTIEAAVLAFKANSKILLKGGKEAHNSNEELVKCWHNGTAANGLSNEWINIFTMNREATQEFLKNPDQQLDLIVPQRWRTSDPFCKRTCQCALYW